MSPNWYRSSAARPPIASLAIACLLLLGRSVAAADFPGPGADSASPSIVVPAETSVRLAELSPGPPQDPQKPDDAQEATAEARGFFSTLVHNLVDDVKHIPRRNSVYWAAGGGALALAVHPWDKEINQRLVGSPGWDRFFTPGKYVGSTGVQFAAGIATYVVGRAREEPRVRHLGMDLIEAQLLADGLVEGLKVIVRRPRPPNPDGTPNSSNTFSFPSGHAAVTFASATVLQQHLGWKAAVPTYLVASYVAISRLHDNRHYLSDVVFDAATGIIVGRSVTWHGRNNYPILPVAGPDFLGVSVTWH